jgi:hypothetical protein
MSTPIKWLPQGGISNHERLALMPAIARLAAMKPSIITCRSPSDGKLYQFIKSGEGWDEMSGTLDVPCVILPEGQEPVQMKVDTLYRDGANYKTHGENVIEGLLTHADLDTILTSLFMDFDGIIPHQVGLEDHQGKGDWPLDFENHDHPWHEISDITITPPKGGTHLPMKQFILLCEDRIKVGWDSIAATIHLQDKHAQN